MVENDGFSGFAWAQEEVEVSPLVVPGSRPVVRVAKIDSQQLNERYLSGVGEPVIVTETSSFLPKWSLDSLAARFPEEIVMANDKAPLCEWDAPGMRSVSVTLREYAAYARSPEDTSLGGKSNGVWYVNSWAPFSKHRETLLKDWSYPPFIEDSLAHDTSQYVEGHGQLIDYSKLFCGVPGCRTRLHFDNLQTHAWLAQIQGRKQFLLFSPADSEKLRLHHWEEASYDGEGLRRSFDPKDGMPDKSIYEDLVQKTTPFLCIVEPGELIVIPRNWWHYALCLDVCVTLMRNFANSTNADHFRQAITRSNDHADRLKPKLNISTDESHKKQCANCRRATAGCRSCSRCRAVAYCGRDCQKQHFAKHHKLICGLLAAVHDDDKEDVLREKREGHPSRSLFDGVSLPKKKTFAKTVLKAGTGRFPPDPDSMVRIHYETFLADGQKIDSSRDKDRPADFHLTHSSLARGLIDATRTMVVGEKARIAVPSTAAYKDRGVDGKVPPNAALIFIVELIMIW